MTNDKHEDLIPVKEVLEDIKRGDGIVSSAARDYYRIHYATDEEKIAMVRQDKLTTIGALLIWCFLFASFIFCIIREVIVR